MPSCWVLLLALLGGGCALPAPMGYPQALSQAVDSYNRRPEVQNAFRLLSADPEPGPLLKDCTAPVVLQGGRAVLDVTCVDSMADPVRVKRVWPLVIRTVLAGYNLYRAIKKK
ncbi:UNVERIFIED_CONTAM: hypothetical protein H355_002852 [Colinus virginianus]|nr:hypothetical protein H355_002852 [Colinus virginianus]